jgi:hypothetical protein
MSRRGRKRMTGGTHVDGPQDVSHDKESSNWLSKHRNGSYILP